VILRCALVATLALSLLVPAAARASAGGAIYLTTLPDGADTWVDGAYVGHSPVLIDALTAGKHTVTTAKTGWISRELRITIVDREPMQFINVLLDHDSGTSTGRGVLALHVGVPIRTLTVDGASAHLSSGGKLDLPAGDHELVVETQSGRFSTHVAILPDTMTNVLVPAGNRSAGRATVVAPVQSYLQASDVVVDGSKITIRHNGHLVTGLVGDATMRIDGLSSTFDTPPAVIGGKLFLPIDLYVRIGALPLRPH